MEFNATIYVTIVSFLIFVWIMNAILYKPLTKIMRERDDLVCKNYDEAQKTNEKTEAILKDKEERLTETAKETRQILLDRTSEANFDYKHRVGEARDRSMRKILELKSELIKSAESAKPVLEEKIEELALTITDKVLKGEQNA